MSTAIVTTSRIEPILDLVLNSVTSSNTRTAYGRALQEFMIWYTQTEQSIFNKATVQAHVAALRLKGVTASSINQRLTAIRKLALEAADNGLIEHSVAQAIGRVEGVRQEGKRLGNWLSQAQAQALLDLPDVSTVKGLRDKALFAILLGCGLRREECAGLSFEHIQQREGRWVIVDLVGKRNKMRSVPMPSWTKAVLDQWATVLGCDTGYIFRRIRRGGHIQPGHMTAQAVLDVVTEYAEKIGVKVSPHD